jgi:hypothetical protein
LHGRVIVAELKNSVGPEMRLEIPCNMGQLWGSKAVHELTRSGNLTCVHRGVIRYCRFQGLICFIALSSYGLFLLWCRRHISFTLSPCRGTLIAVWFRFITFYSANSAIPPSQKYFPQLITSGRDNIVLAYHATISCL